MMICKACGYESERCFPQTQMGKLCCPKCGAENTAESAVAEQKYVSQSVADYAALLERAVANAAPAVSFQDTSDFTELDAWGKKNAAFLNQFTLASISSALWNGNPVYRPEGMTDELWKQELLRRMKVRRSKPLEFNLHTMEDNPSILGFEVLYAAGGVMEFRMKQKKGFGKLEDRCWHTYCVDCGFINGDVRPMMDGKKLKPTALLKVQKVYRYKE